MRIESVSHAPVVASPELDDTTVCRSWLTSLLGNCDTTHAAPRLSTHA